MKKLIFTVMIMGVALFSVNAMAAQDTENPPGEPLPLIEPGDPLSFDFLAEQDGGMQHGRKPMIEELGLSEEQLETLSALRTEHKKQSIALGADIKIVAIELAQLMKVRGNDSAVKAKAAEMANLRMTLFSMGIDQKLQARAIFTDEQWEKVSKMKRGQAKRKHMQGRQGRHPGMSGRQGMRGGQRPGSTRQPGATRRPGR